MKLDDLGYPYLRKPHEMPIMLRDFLDSRLAMFEYRRVESAIPILVVDGTIHV